MTDASNTNPAAEGDEEAPVRNRLVERAPLLLGIAAAIVDLVIIIGWPWEVTVYLHAGMAWSFLGLAALALVCLGRGRNNVLAIVVMVVAAGGYVFWIAAPATLPGLPIWAYVVTAAVHLAIGIFAPKPAAAQQRAVGITVAGVVFFTIMGGMSRLGF